MSDDLKLLKDMLAGLETKGKELAEKQKLFIKAQGLDEAIQRNQKEKDDLADNLLDVKAELKELKAKKKKALAGASEKICGKLNEFLSIGEAFFDASEALSFGLLCGGTRQPYNSLSGGQKQIFNAALENLLGSNIIIMEAAELDKKCLQVLIEELGTVEKQVFINSWFSDGIVPGKFQVVEV